MVETVAAMVVVVLGSASVEDREAVGVMRVARGEEEVVLVEAETAMCKELVLGRHLATRDVPQTPRCRRYQPVGATAQANLEQDIFRRR